MTEKPMTVEEAKQLHAQRRAEYVRAHQDGESLEQLRKRVEAIDAAIDGIVDAARAEERLKMSRGHGSNEEGFGAWVSTKDGKRIPLVDFVEREEGGND